MLAGAPSPSAALATAWVRWGRVNVESDSVS